MTNKIPASFPIKGTYRFAEAWLTEDNELYLRFRNGSPYCGVLKLEDHVADDLRDGFGTTAREAFSQLLGEDYDDSDAIH